MRDSTVGSVGRDRAGGGRAVQVGPARYTSSGGAGGLAWAVLTLACFASWGCMGAQVRPTRPATLLVEATPVETSVFVDGRFAGRATVLSKTGKALRAGVHYVTFSAAGYFPHDVRLDLAPGETTVNIKLRPVPR